jgi:hypothetical protein
MGLTTKNLSLKEFLDRWPAEPAKGRNNPTVASVNPNESQ